MREAVFKQRPGGGGRVGQGPACAKGLGWGQASPGGERQGGCLGAAGSEGEKEERCWKVVRGCGHGDVAF